MHTNILETMPVKRLVIAMSWPIMLSMLMQAIYNLVDSVCLARVSEDAFLALSYAYPIQTLMIAFCVGMGVGLNATLARRLGEKKLGEALQAACHSFLLFGCCWLLFLLFGLIGARPFFLASSENPLVVELGVRYLSICCIFSFGMCLQFVCERLLQSTGHPAGFMIVQGSGALINIILDPILIFGFDLGVTGAAAATVAGQIGGGLIGLCLLARIRGQFPLSFRGFRPRRAMTWEICSVAAPAILMQSLASFMSLGLNQLLTRWSETAVWVLGVYFKIQSFVFMPVFGISSGVIPIYSYNFGARLPQRLSRTTRFACQLSAATGALGLVILFAGAAPLLSLCFQASGPALAMGVPALRLAALSFLFAAVSTILCAAFQSLGYSVYSLLIALLRQILLLLPLAALLLWLRPELVWLCFLLAEALSLLIALPLYRLVHHRSILPLSAPAPLTES